MSQAGSLRDIPLHVTARCAGIGLSPRTGRRLAELGLRPGARITPMARTSGGGLIVRVGGVRIALDAVAVDDITVRADVAQREPVPA